MTSLKCYYFYDARALLHNGSDANDLISSTILLYIPVFKLKVDYSCFRSVGVVIYVMLSGVSPFLGESEEETSSNILRNDYCYIFLYLN